MMATGNIIGVAGFWISHFYIFKCEFNVVKKKCVSLITRLLDKKINK
jgi:hypothetical protein